MKRVAGALMPSALELASVAVKRPAVYDPALAAIGATRVMRANASQHASSVHLPDGKEWSIDTVTAP